MAVLILMLKEEIARIRYKAHPFLGQERPHVAIQGQLHSEFHCIILLYPECRRSYKNLMRCGSRDRQTSRLRSAGPLASEFAKHSPVPELRFLPPRLWAIPIDQAVGKDVWSAISRAFHESRICAA